MARYRKKPVVIEAFHVDAHALRTNELWTNWMHAAWNGERDAPGTLQNVKYGDFTGEIEVVTLEGTMRVNLGDYLIQGVKGELYPCKPDIFEATYEKIEEEPTVDRAKRVRDLRYALEYARSVESLDVDQLAALEGWLERELDSMTEEDQARVSILDPFSKNKGLIDLPVVEGSTLPPRLQVA